MTRASYRLQQRLAAALGILGAVLLLYMVNTEDEPGALPLFLVLAAAVWAASIRRPTP